MIARPAPFVALLSLAFLPLGLPGAASAQQTEAASFSAADIETASYQGGDLPGGRSALTAKVQILLDRSGTSPGVIDGYKGGMSESAIRAFERGAGLPMDGMLDQRVWDLLQANASGALTMDYTITQDDASGLVDSIPTDYAEKAQMSSMGFTSIAEKLGERFHMDEKFIAYLNPGIPIEPGSTIKVTVPAKPIKGAVTRIIVDKASHRVAAYDANGKMVADYPATVGSDATPSPSGDHSVVAIALDPTYTYNPKVNFKQGDNDKVLIVPPGPNAPVGNVWIDLSKPTYGIHGTPTPSQLFVNQSRGCVRLTNWDARELANMVKPGVTKVEFLEPGVTIADVTDVTPAPAPATETEPMAATTPTPALTEGTVVTTTLPAPDSMSDSTPAATDPAITAAPPATEGSAIADAFHEDTTEPDTIGTATEDDALSQALAKALAEQLQTPPTDPQQGQ